MTQRFRNCGSAELVRQRRGATICRRGILGCQVVGSRLNVASMIMPLTISPKTQVNSLGRKRPRQDSCGHFEERATTNNLLQRALCETYLRVNLPAGLSIQRGSGARLD